MSCFDSQILNQLPAASRDFANAQAFGIVKVADDGTVQMYNKWEAEMAGVAPQDAEGKNFFTQVAPCTNNRLVFGKFKDGISRGSLDAEFNYTFTYRMKPTNVVLRLVRDPKSKSNWVLVAKKS
jgi:photoactive yellow protein